MARILGGNPSGEFRGRLGGVVYSRNKSGQVVRQYVKGVDRNSASQIAARSAFSQSVTAFHSLNPSQKLAWQVYGSQYFTSVNKGHLAGVHSGVNAFVSLRNTLLNVQKNSALSPHISVNGLPVVGPIVQSPINFVNEAPAHPFAGKLANYGFSDARVISYSISTGVASIKLSLIPEGLFAGTPSVAASTGSVLQDGNGNFVGFLTKLSSSAPQQNVQVQAPDALILASSGLIEQYTTPSVISNEIQLDLNTGSNVLSSKYYPNVAEQVFASVWMYNSLGEQIRIGGDWLQIST